MERAQRSTDHLHDRGTDRLMADIAALPSIPLTALGPDAVTDRMAALHAARRSSREMNELIQSANRNRKVADRVIACLTSIRDRFDRIGDAIEEDQAPEVAARLFADLAGLTEAMHDNSRCPHCGKEMASVDRRVEEGDYSEVLPGRFLPPRRLHETGYECEDCGYDQTERRRVC